MTFGSIPNQVALSTDAFSALLTGKRYLPRSRYPNAACYVDASVANVISMGAGRYTSTKLLGNGARIEVAERLVPPVIYGVGL